jgi:predicted house-cleaning NTP pyrophosphatase (Maf/HAM1 superfamily)
MWLSRAWAGCCWQVVDVQRWFDCISKFRVELQNLTKERIKRYFEQLFTATSNYKEF